MYKFVQFTNKDDKKSYWYFVPNSVEQIEEHFNKIFGREVKDGVRDYIYHHDWHPTTNFRCGVDSIQKIKGGSWLENALHLENEALTVRIKYFYEGKTLYLANSLTCYMPDERFVEKTDELEKDCLEYPIIEKYKPEDAKISRWDIPGITVGVHWYAKIGVDDVRDEHGNVKWNTREEAEKAVRWYCNKKNNKPQ